MAFGEGAWPLGRRGVVTGEGHGRRREGAWPAALPSADGVFIRCSGEGNFLISQLCCVAYASSASMLSPGTCVA